MDWTHALCGDCWDIVKPDRVPARVKGTLEMCCRCGALTSSGIFARNEPGEWKYCDHDQGFVKTLWHRLELLGAHVENLIQRVHELEGVDRPGPTTEYDPRNPSTQGETP